MGKNYKDMHGSTVTDFHSSNTLDLLTRAYCDLFLYAVLGFYQPYLDPLYWIDNFTEIKINNILHSGNVPLKY